MFKVWVYPYPFVYGYGTYKNFKTENEEYQIHPISTPLTFLFSQLFSLIKSLKNIRTGKY